MRTMTSWIKVVLLCCTLWPPVSQADEIVLNSGERFTSDKVWKENGKIRFNMHGLIVSVNPADVVTIIRDDTATVSQPPADKAAAAPPATSTPMRPAGSPHQAAATPGPKAAFSNKRPPESPIQSPRVRGIGIEGIEWQMRPTEIREIEKIKTDPAYGGIDQYSRSEGNLKMGNALLDGLVFGFWQNRLYTITIWVDGKPGYDRLQRAVFHRYGKGQKNKTGLERYVWLEDTSDRMLEFDDKLNTGIFWMRSRELDQHIKRRYPD